MQPEISHRCRSCGASIRQPDAMFCHECGQALTKPAETSQPEMVASAARAAGESSHNEAIASPLEAEMIAEVNAAPACPPSSVALDDQPLSPVEAKAVKEQSEPSTRGLRRQTPPIAHKTMKHEKARERLHRASAATRDVLADNVKRVEKIRSVSTELIEEASYDPSLRFVLVALGLFVVFVILLVLSKVMG